MNIPSLRVTLSQRNPFPETLLPTDFLSRAFLPMDIPFPGTSLPEASLIMGIHSLGTHISAVPWSHGGCATTAKGQFQALSPNHAISSLFFIYFPILMECQ